MGHESRSTALSDSGLNFAPLVTYGSGGFDAESVVVADVNSDSKPDIIVLNAYISTANENVGSVSVLLGNGDGTFSAAVSYSTGGFVPSSVSVADINGDGKPDIAVVNECASDTNCDNGSDGTVGVLLGNGDGTFQPAVEYDSGGQLPFSVAIGDVNGDGKPDIVVANCFDCGNVNASVGVLLGNGDGTFKTVTTYSSGGTDAQSVAIADVNGDGKLDLVVANYCLASDCVDGIVSVLLGVGDGTFQPAVPYGSGGFDATSVAVADVNGDGKPDLLVANDCVDDTCSSTGSVGILLGNGDGTFQAAMTYGSGGNAQFYISVAVGDVNGDGKQDIVVNNYYSSSIAVMLGNGDGTFQTAVPFGSGQDTQFVAVADVNGDGKPDLLIADYAIGGFQNGGIVGVLINTSTTATTTSGMSSVNPSNFGQSVTFTATVAAQAGFSSGTPTGTVNFLDGNAILGNSSLNFNGVATFASSSLAVGTHSVTATYSGDAKFASSTSPVLSQIVQGAIALISPSSLSFGSQTVGIASLSQSVTLTNTGNVALSLTSIVLSLSNGSYTQTNTCGSSLSTGASCTVALTWTPSTAGSMTGSLTFTDNAPGSPQTVSLSGTGVTPAVTFSPSSLTFATQVVFTTSAAQGVTLSNASAGLLTITKISVSGQFTQTNNCGGSVAAGGSCTFSVKFKPTTSGTLTGSISITDNASGSPQKITLTGTGTDVQFTPTSLNFGNQPVGTKSLPKKITLSNKASVAVSITSISITGTNKGDFAETNTCGKTVKAGASCSITVTFTPSAKGKRTGNVSVSDNGGGSPQTVGLSGTGT